MVYRVCQLQSEVSPLNFQNEPPPKILMFDDNEALLSFFAKELEKRGFEIHQSVSGDEALHVWQELGPWDFVLSDFRNPS
jgi:CheY-like chemotaxis protein